MPLDPAGSDRWLHDPASVDPGGTVTGTITLTGPAPNRWGFNLLGEYIQLRNAVRLQSSSPSVTLPATVVFDPGDVTRTFQATIGPGAPPSVTITGTYMTQRQAGFNDYLTFPGRTRTATLTVLVPVPTALTLDPATVEPGGTSTATVTLDRPARPGGTAVTLTSSNPLAATVPATLTIPEGEIRGTFTVTSLASAPAETVTISASAGGVTRTALLSLALPRLTGVAPGWTLPGATDLVAYGSGFDPGTTVKLEGPVYALGDYSLPLCNVVIYQCPV